MKAELLHSPRQHRNAIDHACHSFALDCLQTLSKVHYSLSEIYSLLQRRRNASLYKNILW